MKRVIPVLALAASLSVSGILARPSAQTTRAGDPGQTPEKLDYAAIALIRDEGLNRSQVMDHISWLSDVYGPRLTGGPGIMQASDWAIRSSSSGASRIRTARPSRSGRPGRSCAFPRT